MHRWANGTSRISESFCRTDVEFLFFFFHHRKPKSSSASVWSNRVCLHLLCVGVGVWAGYRWARLLPVTVHGLNYSSCCGCWSATCRVPWALMNSPMPECVRKKYNEAKRTLETRTIWERVTHSVSLHITKLWRLATTSKRSLITWQNANDRTHFFLTLNNPRTSHGAHPVRNPHSDQNTRESEALP